MVIFFFLFIGNAIQIPQMSRKLREPIKGMLKLWMKENHQ